MFPTKDRKFLKWVASLHCSWWSWDHHMDVDSRHTSSRVWSGSVPSEGLVPSEDTVPSEDLAPTDGLVLSKDLIWSDEFSMLLDLGTIIHCWFQSGLFWNQYPSSCVSPHVKNRDNFKCRSNIKWWKINRDASEQLRLHTTAISVKTDLKSVWQAGSA